MMDWMEMYVQDQLEFQEYVVLVPSHELNPEDTFYYQHAFEKVHSKSVPCEEYELPNGRCKKKSKDQIENTIS